MTYIIYLQLHDEAHFVPVFTNFLLQVLIIATFFVQQQLKNVTNLFAMYLTQSNKQKSLFSF